MDNTQYIKKTISIVDMIYIDTSALMEQGFRQFIIDNRGLLLAEGKKIVVSKAVYTELARHLKSSNPYKIEGALKAVELLVLNKELFQVENSPLTDEEIEKAFADPEILSALTINKIKYRQLLIVNDKKLSRDAFDLNSQESCKGQKVFVCYINDIGELHCCDCARAESKPTTVPIKKAVVTPVTTIQTAPVAAVSSSTSTLPIQKTHFKIPSRVTKEEPERWRFDWKSAGVGFAGAIGIGLLGLGAYKAYKAYNRNNFILEVVR